MAGHDQSDGKNKLENVESHTGTEDSKNYAANLPGVGGSVASMASTKTKLRPNSKKRLNNDIDLNKRPRKKPKKKVHRPKVVSEGKPRKTLAPMTPKKAAPKRALKSKKPKPAAKERVLRKRKNLSKLKNSVTPSVQSEEKIDPTFVSNLEDDENTSTADTEVTRHNQAVEGSVNDCGCSYNSLSVYQSKYKAAGDCLISIRKITPMFPYDSMRRRTRRRAEVSKMGRIVLPTRKKRTKNMCTLRRNLALLIAPPVLFNQTGPLDEAALASKILEIEVKEGMVAETWTEEHKNLPSDNKSRGNSVWKNE